MKQSSYTTLIALIFFPFMISTQTTAVLSCGSDNGTCPSGYSFTITPSGQNPWAMCLSGNSCGSTTAITLTFWECSSNYAGEKCSSNICFNGTSTYVTSPTTQTVSTCPNTTVTSTCGECSDAGCTQCTQTSGNQYCVDSCNFLSATVQNKVCENKEDMFGQPSGINCCYYYEWKGASGNNGICSTGSGMPKIYSQAIASYLGISTHNGAVLEISRIILFVLITLFLFISKL